MTNLWATVAGRAATKEAIYQIIRRRMSRFFGRKFVVQFNEWIQSGKTAFSFLDTLGDLNDFHDTEILNLYELLGVIGEAPETLADIDYWITEAGDDINGLGNIDSPFASVSRALAAIENTVINHRVRILVDNTTAGVLTGYTDDVWYLPHDIRSGSLSIVGVGPYIETFADQVLSAYAALGSGGHQYSVAGAPWIANEWQGSFMVPQDGAAKDRAFSVQQNSTGALYTHKYTTIPGAADTVHGIAPPVSINLNKITIKGQGPDIVAANVLGSRIAIANLRLNFTDSTHTEGQFETDSAEQRVYLDFVTMIFKDGTTNNLQLKNSRINEYEPVDDSIELISASGVDALGTVAGPGFTCYRKTKGLADAIMAFIDESTVNRMTITENIGGEALGTARLFSCALGGGSAVYVPLWYLDSCFCSNNGAVDAFSFTMGDLKFTQSYIQAGNNGIKVSNARVYLADMVCDPAIVRFSMEAGPNVFIETGDNLGVFVGTLGALNFTAPNPDVVVAWPAAGAIVTDGLITSTAVQAG